MWFWCSYCERAFSRSLPDCSPVDLETGDLLSMPEGCPFEGCPSGHIHLWWKYRQVNDYPKIPLWGVLYPLHPTDDDYNRILWMHEFVKGLHG